MTFYRLNWIKICKWFACPLRLEMHSGTWASPPVLGPGGPAFGGRAWAGPARGVCPCSVCAGGERDRTTFNANTPFFPRGCLLKPCSIFNCLPHKLIFLALLTSKISSPLAMILFSTPAPPQKQINHLQKIPKEERVTLWAQWRLQGGHCNDECLNASTACRVLC